MPLKAQMFGGKEQDWEQLAGRLRESLTLTICPAKQAGVRVNGFARRRDKGPEGHAMITSVREGSRIGPCDVLGELVGETATRYVYRRRNVTAFVKKRSPSIHILPCKACADYRHK